MLLPYLPLCMCWMSSCQGLHKVLIFLRPSWGCPVVLYTILLHVTLNFITGIWWAIVAPDYKWDSIYSVHPWYDSTHWCWVYNVYLRKSWVCIIDNKQILTRRKYATKLHVNSMPSFFGSMEASQRVWMASWSVGLASNALIYFLIHTVINSRKSNLFTK